MARFIDQIDSPVDLKKLSLEQLEPLAEEIRGDLISIAAKKGGHFGATMGVVELTIALHYVFNTPDDKLIWDVGHQAYAHKMLTGRRKNIGTIRQYGGLAPFCRPSESEYDAFGAGHASTSVGLGVGMAEAFRLQGKDNKVIPIIGDGSATGGPAFEGLNNAGFTNLNMMVVFNENSMSIDPNVGALFNFASSFLSRKMTEPFMLSLRDRVKGVLGKVSHGDDLIRLVRHAEESFMNILTPGMIFESLGFFYVGPISGYDFPKMVETFENVKNMHRPVVVHVRTTKGKGYGPAEADQVFFHGPKPFDIPTGKPLPSKGGGPPSYTGVFTKTLCKLAETNEKIYGITAAMPTGAGMKKFGEMYPDRYRDVGIAEQCAVLMASGLATEGFVPVCAIYSTFLQRAYDQIIHDVGIHKLPVVFAMDRGGLVGADGPTHHGVYDHTYMRSIPGMIHMAPRDENELQHMLKTAIECGKPVGLRYPRGNGIGVPMDPEPKTLEIGKGEVMVDHNDADITFFGIGSTVYPCLNVAKKIEEEYGIRANVVNSRFIKPLDEELTARMAKKVKYVLAVEENIIHGGFTGAIAECLVDHGVTDVKVKRLGTPDAFVDHGSQAELRRDHGIDEAGIFKSALELMKDHPKLAKKVKAPILQSPRAASL